MKIKFFLPFLILSVDAYAATVSSKNCFAEKLGGKCYELIVPLNSIMENSSDKTIALNYIVFPALKTNSKQLFLLKHIDGKIPLEFMEPMNPMDLNELNQMRATQTLVLYEHRNETQMPDSDKTSEVDINLLRKKDTQLLMQTIRAQYNLTADQIALSVTATDDSGTLLTVNQPTADGSKKISVLVLKPENLSEHSTPKIKENPLASTHLSHTGNLSPNASKTESQNHSDSQSAEDMDSEEVVIVANKKEIFDPLEPINRPIFAFNEVIRTRLMSPFIEKFYKVYTPQVVQDGIYNFTNNLLRPKTIVNQILQAEFAEAFKTLIRGIIDTTVGIAGLFNVSKHIGLGEQIREDFGQTLAVWLEEWLQVTNDSSGFCVVLPFLGPSNVRDVGGLVVDTAINEYIGPFNFLPAGEMMANMGNQALFQISNYPGDEKIEYTRRNSVDFYQSVCYDLYNQDRKNRIKERKTAPWF